MDLLLPILCNYTRIAIPWSGIHYRHSLTLGNDLTLVLSLAAGQPLFHVLL